LFVLPAVTLRLKSSSTKATPASLQASSVA
jgi:hypothetical protein